MKKDLKCQCAICAVEQSLFLCLSEPPGSEQFSKLVRSSSPLESFVSISALLEHLHARGSTDAPSVAGELLATVIRLRATSPDIELLQSILILAFMPTLHRTYREVCVCFPELEVEDVAQQLFTFFLELAASKHASMLNGLLPIALVRSLRKQVFRWAEKEKRQLWRREPELKENAERTFADSFEQVSMLRDFLGYCRELGMLSRFEHDLLVEMKIDGFSAKEMQDRHTVLSERAVLLRLHRIMQRLQETAKALNTETVSTHSPEQENSRRTKKDGAIVKHFSLKHSVEFLPISN